MSEETEFDAIISDSTPVRNIIAMIDKDKNTCHVVAMPDGIHISYVSDNDIFARHFVLHSSKMSGYNYSMYDDDEELIPMSPYACSTSLLLTNIKSVSKKNSPFSIFKLKDKNTLSTSPVINKHSPDLPSLYQTDILNEKYERHFDLSSHLTDLDCKYIINARDFTAICSRAHESKCPFLRITCSDQLIVFELINSKDHVVGTTPYRSRSSMINFGRAPKSTNETTKRSWEIPKNERILTVNIPQSNVSNFTKWHNIGGDQLEFFIRDGKALLIRNSVGTCDDIICFLPNCITVNNVK